MKLFQEHFKELVSTAAEGLRAGLRGWMLRCCVPRRVAWKEVTRPFASEALTPQ